MKRITASLATALATALAGALCSGAAAHAAPLPTPLPTPLQASGQWTHKPVGSAPTPPMGWNSWNAFGVDITEAKVMAAAEAIKASGLQAAGYTNINIDDGWWRKRRLADGRMQIRTNLFPSAATGGVQETSFRPFTDRLHAMGFKAGIYTDIGYNACSQAWASDNPNLPEGTQAEREVGLHGHVAQDMALYFGAWNFDTVKVDACGLAHYGPSRSVVRDGTYRAFGPIVADAVPNRTDIPKVMALYREARDALRRVRPKDDFILSLCNWGAANVRAWGQDYGTTWRTSNDIDATWGRMLHNFDSVSTRELYAGPGRWNDPDMLEVGNGAFDAGHLTEARAHMSLWSIMAAPLIIGTDLGKTSPAILAVLGNREVIAVNQDAEGDQGVLAYTDSERAIIVKTLGDGRGRKAVVLFNRTAAPTDITLTAQHLKLRGDQPIALRDLWAQADLAPLGGQRVFHLAPHEAIMLTAAGSPLLAGGRYLSDMPARIHVAADGIRVLEPDPVIHRPVDPYNPSTTSSGNRPAYAGWGGPRADATPYDQTLAIAGATFRSGLGTLANAHLEVKAQGQFQRFAAQVGVDDSTRGRRAAVRFEVYGDGRLLAASRPMRFGMAAEPISAPVAGVKVVELIARQIGTDAGNVVATWAEARFEDRK